MVGEIAASIEEFDDPEDLLPPYAEPLGERASAENPIRARLASAIEAFENLEAQPLLAPLLAVDPPVSVESCHYILRQFQHREHGQIHAFRCKS